MRHRLRCPTHRSAASRSAASGKLRIGTYWLEPGAQPALVGDDPSAPASLHIKLHNGDAADAGQLDYLGLNYTLRFR